MIRRRLLGAAALIAVGLVLIAIGRFFRGVDEADVPTASTPSSPANPDGEAPPAPPPTTPNDAAKAAPSQLTLTPGATWEEQVEASFEARAGGAKTPSRLTLSGRRLGACYRADANAALIGLRYEAVLSQDGEQAPALAEELAAEILVVLDRRNRLTHVGLPGDVSAEVRNLHRALLSLGAFALPPQANAERWQEEGEGPSGAFRDQYSRLGATTIRTRVYTSIRGLTQEGAGYEAQGEARAEVGASGLVESLTAQEQVTISWGSGQLDLESHLGLRWVGRLAQGLRTPEARLAQVEATLGPSPWSKTLAPEQGGATAKPPPAIEDVLAHLAHAGRGEGFREAAPRIFLDLLRRLRMDEGALEPTLAALRDSGLPLDVRSTILDALGEAGTARAQLALVALLEEGLPDDLLPSLFLALGAPREPLPEVIRALEGAGYVGDPARERDPTRAAWATRASGILAGRAGAEQADSLAKGLSTALGPDPEADLVILEALGNAGRESTLPAVEPYLSAKEDALRAAAVAALRKLDPERVEALVVARLEEDPSPDVRREAVRTLGELSPLRDAVRAGGLTALKDGVPEVRRDAVKTIQGWLGSPTLTSAQRDALADALRAVAQTDPDASVQTAAREGS